MKSNFEFELYDVNNRFKLFFVLSFLIAILDQCLKFFAIKYSYNKLILIPKFLWLNLVENTGAAFGIFSGKTYLLGLVNLFVFVLISYYSFKNKLAFRDFLPLTFVAGGALGNAIDRLIFGSVIDFIDLGWFPVFNVADSFIVLGFIWLIVNEFVKWKQN